MENQKSVWVKATLISKGTFGKNFKLTFSRDKGKSTYYLVLHEWRKKAYQDLELGQTYLYQWRKGFKNYSFITHLEPNQENQSINWNQPQTEIKNNPIIQQIIKDLQIKDGTEKSLQQKLEKLKLKTKQLSTSDNSALLLNWIEEILSTFWLQLKQLPSKQTQTETQQRISKMITNLSAMFLSEYLYDDNCRWVEKENVFCPSCNKKSNEFLQKQVLEKIVKRK
jgi:hypothetical protein